MTGERTLDVVRKEIDAIDDAIQDLIVRRTELVADVRTLKQDSRIKIRPSREAKIIYRLMARHRGPFPKRELIAIWRLLITATLSFEGPFSVAVYMPTEGSGYWDLARDQYGLFTPMTRHGSVRSVIEAVHRQEAVVGVLPLPRQDDVDPWWRHIVTSNPDAPRIIARLPFAGPGNGLGGELEALVISPVSLTPTGRDLSYFAVEMETRLGVNQFRSALDNVDLLPRFVSVWGEEERPTSWLYLVESEGFLTAGDQRLLRIGDALAKQPIRIVLLGGYAQPLSAEDLGLSPAKAQKARRGHSEVAEFPVQ